MDNNMKKYLNSLEVSDITYESYVNELERFWDFLKGLNKNTNTVTPTEMAKYPDYLDNLGLKNTTIRSYIGTVKRLYSFMELEGLGQDKTYKIRAPRVQKKTLPAFLDNNEIDLLMKEVRSEPNEFLRIRNEFIMLLFIYHGLRVQELVDLRLNDIKDDILTIQKGKGGKARMLVLAGAVLDSYNEYKKVRKGQSDKVFVSELGAPIKKRAVQHMVSKYMEQAGLEQFSVHSLRHTCAVLMMDNGLDVREVQEILGHSDIATTQIYASVSTRNKRRIASVMDSIAI